MKITLKQAYRTLKPCEITLNRGVNFWVGSNGTGKSSLVQLLLGHLWKHKKLGKQHDYHARCSSSEADMIELQGMEHISALRVFSDKQRQTAWLDMEVALGAPGGLGVSLQGSEGQNAYAALSEAKGSILDPNALLIFDELDGHLDFAGKYAYFNKYLHAIRGTAIVISHDSLFLTGHEVFDFTDLTHRSGELYYERERARCREAASRPKPV